MKWDETSFFPPFYRQADGESIRCQTVFLRWRGAEFICLALAASFALLPRDLAFGSGPWLAVLAFVVPIVIRLSQVEQKAERRWYDARAAAESMKTATWQYAVGGESYRKDDATARQRFLDLVAEICRALPSWQTGTTGDGSLVTEDMATIRESALRDRVRTYIDHRVVNQVNWYKSKADWNRKRAFRWGVGIIAVEVVALGVGIVNLIQPLGLDYLGALAAIAAGLAGWKQTKRFNELAEAYSLTSNETFLVKDSLDSSSEDAWAQSVTSAETAFSREHSMWLARRQGPLH